MINKFTSLYSGCGCGGAAALLPRHITQRENSPINSKNPDLDFFRNLPQEIAIDILLRLPIQTIISCKLVNQPWRNLLESLDFATFHLSKSEAPHLFVFQGKRSPIPYKLFQFVDEQNPANRCKKVSSLTFLPHTAGPALGSVDGLLFMCDGDELHTRRLYACNPMTREYIKLPPPKVRIKLFTAGVGVSKTGGQYKVVRVCKTSKLAEFECHVHTLGTDSWRSFPPGAGLEYSVKSLGAFVNGNLHWLVKDSKHNEWISCFDLENETFSIYASPSSSTDVDTTLSAVEDRLCLCANGRGRWGAVAVLWFMKDYGDEKSWSKEVEIDESHLWDPTLSGFVFPIKVLKDGDILLAMLNDEDVFCYSKETGAVCSIGINEGGSLRWYRDREVTMSKLVVYTPSFLPLRRFVEENVFVSDDFRVQLF